VIGGALEGLFAPRGVAVVGASIDPTKLGSVMAASLATGPAPVLRVNARRPDPDAGLYPSIAAARDTTGTPVDLVVSCVPAVITAEVVVDAAAAGASAVLVCAGGFAEAGGDGVAHQAAVEEAVGRTGIRLLGPNTSGFVVPHRGLTASFVPGAAQLRPGGVAVVATSGGVNHALAFGLAERGLGVRLAVGLGGAVDVTQADVLEHLVADDELTAVVLHIETVRDGRRLVDAVRTLVPRVPVLALVLGRSDVGAFAASHTGALATSWRTARAALAQAGAVLVDDDRELLDAATTLARRRLPPRRRPGIGLVTAQAGPGLLVADGARAAGVDLPELTPTTIEALAGQLPPLTYQRNPVDTGRPSASFGAVLRTVAADDAIDGVAAYALLEPSAFDLAGTLAELPADLALVLGTAGPSADLAALREAASASGHPVVDTAGALVAAVRAWSEDSRARARLADAAPAPAVGPLELPDRLDEDGAKGVLDQLGVRTPRREVCGDPETARAALERFGTAVVKLLDPEVTHKTEVGGVHVGVASTALLDQALAALRSIGATEVLVEEQAPDGPELLVGVRRDPVFGPLVVLGLGGTVAEVLQQVVVRLAPLSLAEATAMVADLPGRAVLEGFRGGPVLRTERLAEVLVALADALVATPALDELEVNPLRVLPDGDVVALDAVLVPARRTGSGAPSVDGSVAD
jgi:acyl-CoA synthetase (NDP forming)